MSDSASRLSSLLAAVFVAALILGVASAQTTQPRPGSLDRSFGSGGIVTADLAQGGGAADAMVLQPDGKIVVGGEGWVDADWDFVLGRLNPDGTFDPTFGRNGQVTTDFGGSERIEALARRPDGKIVAAGNGAAGLELARYRPNGSLDQSFGKRGKLAIAPSPLGAAALALQADGKIVVAGTKSTGEFAVARFSPNGTVDTEFGDAGVATVRFSGTNVASAMAVQPDGKIVVGGSNWDTGGVDLARFDAGGALDPSFGVGGRLASAAGTLCNALVLQPDGKIVVAGMVGDEGFGLMRYRSDGSVDRSFGEKGASLVFSEGRAASLAIQPDGRIVAVGFSYDSDGLELALARVTKDGTLDSSFWSTGVRYTVIPEWSVFARAVAIQRDGRIVVAGERASPYVDYSPPPELLVVRYVGGPGCVVPNVKGVLLRVARARIKGARCAVGHIIRRFSATRRAGHVISQAPKPRTRRGVGFRVALVVSKGPRGER